MSRLGRVLAGLRGDMARTVLANTSARVLALAGLAAATIVVARVGGPSDVGVYALLRMLPGLVGVLCVAGLPGAMSYFLAAPRRDTPGLWPTVVVVAVAGSVFGTVVWVAGAPLLADVFFPGDPTWVIAAAGVTVSTQLLLTVGKTSLQGLGDRRGADVVIAAEEIAFLPCYAAVLLVGSRGTVALLLALAAADLVVGVDAWRRIARRNRWRRWGLARTPHGWWGRPNRALATEVVTYGVRGQVGGVMTLLNMRLDFLILGAMTGPAVVGTYAVASKYAELLRLPGTAMTWVSYPMLAGLDGVEAARRSQRLVLPAVGGTVLGAVPFLLLAGPVMNLLYGESFDTAVAPAQLLVLGMLLGGGAGVASGYLYAQGRPGLNSVALGLGLMVTVSLDLLLIPRYGVMGAAVASTTAYLVTDALLIWLLRSRTTAVLRAHRERPAMEVAR